MSRSSALILLGILTLLAPFLGLPTSWTTPLLVIVGILVAAIGLALRSEQVRRAHEAMRSDMPLPPAPAPISAPEPFVTTEPPAPHRGPSSIA